MNKTEFIEAVAQKSELTKADAKKAVNAFCDVIAEAMKKDEKVTIIGFGTFLSDQVVRHPPYFASYLSYAIMKRLPM